MNKTSCAPLFKTALKLARMRLFLLNARSAHRFFQRVIFAGQSHRERAAITWAGKRY
jgi:hypothetical protein